MQRPRVTKKQRALELFRQGMGVCTIAEHLETSPSYVANVLIDAGYVPDYVDLYTSTGPQNPYARMLAGVLRFKDRAAAHESIARINELYERFVAERDRRGIHQCQVLALIGKNRAEGVGKLAEARLFAAWLRDHLDVIEPAPTRETQPTFEKAEDLPRAA
ncbi:MAG: hypothetical protein HY320_14765 [Armatimonadetes bacterium]|nr:hypothetical protein [Armatimonadota bacterium]